MAQDLVCYDYGAGGVWRWMEANCAADIHRTYRDLTVFEAPPAWWTKDEEALTPRVRLEDPPDAFLKTLVRPTLEP